MLLGDRLALICGTMEALAGFGREMSAVCLRLALSHKHTYSWVCWSLSIWTKVRSCVGVCVYCVGLCCCGAVLLCQCALLWLFDSGKSLFRKSPWLWFMRGRRDTGCMRRENIPQHTPTHPCTSTHLLRGYAWNTHKPHFINTVYQITDDSAVCCLH